MKKSRKDWEKLGNNLGEKGKRIFVEFSGFRASTQRRVIAGSLMIAGPANLRRLPGRGQKDSRCRATAEVARVEKGKRE
jgi:hypothetical protein